MCQIKTVLADEYSLTIPDTPSFSMDFDENREVEITLDTTSTYYLSCSNESYNSVVSIINDDSLKKCTVVAGDYGLAKLKVQVNNSSFEAVETKYFTIDIDTDVYLQSVLDRFPSVITEKNAYFELNKYKQKILGNSKVNIYQSETMYSSNGYSCDLVAALSFRDYDGISTQYTTVKKSKKVFFANNELYPSPSQVTINKNNTSDITLNNFKGKGTDLIWVSEDNTIASVNQKGKITGLSKGKTNIKVYNRKTMEYATISVEVTEPTYNNIDSFLATINNNTAEIDIGTFTYLPNSFEEYARDYIQKQFKEKLDLKYQYSYANLSCNEEMVCNGTVSYYEMSNMGQNNNSKPITNLTLSLKGIRINTSTGMSLDTTGCVPFSVNSKLDDGVSYVVNYDEDYLSLNNGCLSALKVGTSTITVLSTDGYTNSVEFTINIGSTTTQEIINYVNNIKIISLPYNSLIALNDINYLEKILKYKIEGEYPNEDIRPYLDGDVYCKAINNCVYTVSVNDEEGNSITYNRPSTGFIINYTNSENTLGNLINLDKQIKGTYIISLNDTVLIENTCAGDDNCFYNSLYAKTNIDTLETNGITITKEMIKTYPFKNGIHGGIEYLLTYKKGTTILYKKTINIISDHIISVSPELENTNSVRIDEASSYLYNLLNNDVEIININDNVYQITNNTNVFNIIIDQKEKELIRYIQVNKRYASLAIDETETIEYSIYPSYANSGTITFKSNNEAVATVSDDGVITAVGNGYTFIHIKYGYSTSCVLVTVGMSLESVLNNYVNQIDNDYIITYGDLNNQSISQVLQNYIYSNLYEKIGYENAGYFTPQVEEDNDEYYAQVCYQTTNNYDNRTCSSGKKITYEIKGIKLNEITYDLDVGEEVNTGLLFTEGDNNNLVFQISDKSIATIDKNGVIKALKPGIVTIYINDKYYQYWNYVKVRVDFEDYYSSVLVKAKENPIEINILDLGTDEINPQYYNAFSKSFEKFASFYELFQIENNGPQLNCDLDEETCNVKVTKTDYETWTQTTLIDENFDIVKTGVEVEKDVEIDINEEYSLIYSISNDSASSLTITPIDNTICTVISGKVKGLSPGVCTLKYQTSKYLNYQHIIVGKNNIKDIGSSILDNIPNTIEIKAIEATGDDDDTLFIMEETIRYTIKEIVNNDNYDISYSVLNDNDPYNNTLTISYMYNFADENIYYYNDVYFDIPNVSKNVIFNFTGLNEEELLIGERLENELETDYELSMEQYLKMRLDGKKYGLREYSDFDENLQSICATCKLVSVGGFGGEDGGYITEGGDYMIFHNGYSITTLTISFKANTEIEISGEVKSEEEYIELLKKAVKDAYNKAQNNSNAINKSTVFKSYVPNIIKGTNDVEVLVEKKFDTDLMKNIYEFTIDTITFSTVIDTKYVGSTKSYTYSVTDITLNKESVTLTAGGSETITATIAPTNATNKNLLWTTSNSAVATVNNGVITAIGAGDATITVKSADGSVTKTISVKVNAVVETIIYGDINEDGKVNINDLIKLRKNLAGLETLSVNGNKSADVNKDGKVNMNDLIKMRKHLAGLENI